jgi:cyclopropane fatty-acyl-phospholipid synthase-like methyltransferase
MDAGCGQGSALIALARRFPRSRFTGYDFAADAIAHAATAVRNAGLDNIRFEVRELTGYEEQGRFDFVTSFDAVHDQKDRKT